MAPITFGKPLLFRKDCFLPCLSCAFGQTVYLDLKYLNTAPHILLRILSTENSVTLKRSAMRQNGSKLPTYHMKTISCFSIPMASRPLCVSSLNSSSVPSCWHMTWNVCLDMRKNFRKSSILYSGTTLSTYWSFFGIFSRYLKKMKYLLPAAILTQLNDQRLDEPVL